MAITPDEYHIATYRGMIDESGCALNGRVLQRPMLGGPKEDDDWWDNLLNTYRRFASQRMAGVSIEATFRGRTGTAVTDDDGYYELRLPVESPGHDSLWDTAEVMRSEGGPVFEQPVLCVPESARFGVISDIDDTVLESNITNWQTAAQLTFLHNARTRKPLEGVAQLYQAFQRGRDGKGPNPIFYVSASPWNLYDLLEDFFDLNEIPQGPILLRDMDLDRNSFRPEFGARGKLERVHQIIDRFPSLQWVLMGDSGQIDAELYGETVAKYPGRILAVYIRDIDPLAESSYDQFVDTHIERIAGSGVPMLRVTDSNAIAAHARTLALIEPEEIKEVAKEVQLDHVRPELKDAVPTSVAEAVGEAISADGKSA